MGSFLMLEYQKSSAAHTPLSCEFLHLVVVNLSTTLLLPSDKPFSWTVILAADQWCEI
jgi:hypothetical protein